MKKLANLVKGGIETIIIVVLLVAVVVGLFIAVILPMVTGTTDMDEDVTGNMTDNAGEWVQGNF